MQYRTSKSRWRHPSNRRVVVIGAGFAGLAAALDLVRAGLDVTVLERQPQVGGLAASFDVAGEPLEKFYHHLFVHDDDILRLVRELGGAGDIVVRRSRTGLYHQGRIHRLSTPWDLLKFSPLGLRDRLRLGLAAIKARRLRDWQALENVTAERWLTDLCGQEAYRIVWRPLLYGKFGRYSPRVSAVWFWNKLKLRGGSRGRGGAESLVYFRGGFASVLRRLTDAIAAAGGRIVLGARADGIEAPSGRVSAVRAGAQTFLADAVICTTPLPAAADMLAGLVDENFLAGLKGVQYLAALCLVLELDRALSDVYWLNVCDETFPYVGIIEHTNFAPAATYGGRHVVYLAKYLPTSDPMYAMPEDDLLDLSCRRLEEMFPTFDRRSVLAHHLFRADFAQHVVTTSYCRNILLCRTPLANFYLCSMAQIYPEDRGTNYAVRQGRAAAQTLIEDLRPV